MAVIASLALTACGSTQAEPLPDVTPPAGDLGNGLVDPAASLGPAPSLEFELPNGDVAELASYLGQPLVLNFFAEWCAPCVREMPEFEAVHQQVGDQVTFLGISIQDLPDRAAAIVAETGVTYDYGIDQRGSFLVEFGTATMPSTVFISADGEVLEVRKGELQAESLLALIERNFGITA